MINVHIGPLPPPFGGISVYLYRLSLLDKRSRFIDTKSFENPLMFDIWLIKQIFSLKRNNYIYHSPSLKTRLKFYFLSLISPHNFSLVIHGNSLIDHYRKSQKFIRYLIRKMLNSAKFIQVVDPKIKSFIQNIGIKNKSIFIKPAFLPPPLDEEQKIFNTFNSELLTFIESRNPIIIANASFLRIYNNIDLYGLDLCIELTYLLKKEFPRIGFIFALASDSFNKEYLNKKKMRIKELNIKKNFIFITGQKEIWPLFKKVDLMIRPTYRDSYGISIAEALYFGTPAVASNVCKRPSGTIIFENRNLQDLYNKSREILIRKYKKIT
ncbi:MAG: glycosyltransferase [Promethearchaeota archaeon]